MENCVHFGPLVSAYSNVIIKLLLVQQKFFLFHRIIRMEISGLKKAVPTVSELFGDMSYGPGVVTNVIYYVFNG